MVREIGVWVIGLGLVVCSRIDAGEIGKVYLGDNGREYKIEAEQIIDDFEAGLSNWKTTVVGEKEPKGIIDISLNTDKNYCKGAQSLKINFQKNASDFAWIKYYGLSQGDGANYNALGFYLYLPDRNLTDFRVNLYYAPRADLAGTCSLKNCYVGEHYYIIPKESFTGMTDERWRTLNLLFFYISGKDTITAYIDNISFLKVTELEKTSIVIDNFEGSDIGNWRCSPTVWKEGRGQEAEKKFADISLNEEAQYVKEGKKSLKVSCAAEAEGEYVLLQKPKIPSPSSDTDAITFWVYSEEGGGRFDLYLFNSTTWKSFVGSFVIDFVGWKKFVIPKDRMKAKDIEWTETNYLQFILFGNFTIYLDDIRFESSKTAKEIIERPGESPKGEDITPQE